MVDTLYREAMTSDHSVERAPLSLESIVAASVHIADHDGLESVSIRSVAAALRARPMSLYSFITSKDDLISRMLDNVMSEIVLEDIPDNWREALFAIARRTIQIGTRHPWIVAASLQSDTPGPNMLTHTNQTLAVLSGAGVEGRRAETLATAIDVYVIGFATLWKNGSDAPADDRLFTDGLNWLLDGFEHQRSR
ncbi:TetR/AcrR family transcriptional regulator [Microbacterium elymi]|uniref:TetR/AcrR family transcriptional regulator n=1 Tax=Microbacterium elymi TaxID=2909587 RepID=A0ABY5NJG2_9MICO|nr:TetR/AcrR family transcriptional regulator [Microbacterium elymi]UUT35301.1 TetR/AcrR family transcriptional regulator [Microbacterium elymi]